MDTYSLPRSRDAGYGIKLCSKLLEIVDYGRVLEGILYQSEVGFGGKNHFTSPCFDTSLTKYRQPSTQVDMRLAIFLAVSNGWMRLISLFCLFEHFGIRGVALGCKKNSLFRRAQYICSI